MNKPRLIDERLRRPLLVAWLLLASCATIPPDIEPPRISITNLAPKEFAMFEQRFDVQLRIQNPNQQDLGINGIRFDIELNEREFANGMSGERLTVPRFGSQVLNVEVVTGTTSFIRQFQEFNKTGVNNIHYRLKGTAFVDAPSSFKLPFDEKGNIDLGLGQATEPQQ